MIYYVEDDTNIRELAIYALRQAGLDATGFSSADSFLATCEKELPSLILLDIMLPGIDGLELLARLRGNPRTTNIPVMMLTAKGTEYDKVSGLDAGADDYLAKPFGMMELVSRCNALLRRASRQTAPRKARDATIVECGPLTLDSTTREARAGNTTLDLTLKEFDMLEKLMTEQGRALTRSQIFQDVWGEEFLGESRTVDTHVQTLRRKLNDAYPGAGNLIQTVRGIGYRLKADG